jgi:hypothetical protein
MMMVVMLMPGFSHVALAGNDEDSAVGAKDVDGRAVKFAQRRA